MWDTRPKIERNKNVRRLHALHPELSYERLAEVFDITRQRIGVILKKDGKGVSVGTD